MDNLHNKLNFNLVKKNQIPGKNLLKVVKFQNLVEKCVENIALCTTFANFLITVLRAEIDTTFGS